MEKYLKVGKILKAQGLKGEVKVYSTTSFKDIRYKKGSHLFIKDKNDNYIDLVVNTFYSKGENLDVISFVDHDSIESVEPLLNHELFALKDESILFDNGRFLPPSFGQPVPIAVKKRGCSCGMECCQLHKQRRNTCCPKRLAAGRFFSVRSALSAQSGKGERHYFTSLHQTRRREFVMESLVYLFIAFALVGRRNLSLLIQKAQEQFGRKHGGDTERRLTLGIRTDPMETTERRFAF